VENADLRSLAGLDTLNASLLLRKLRDRSLLEIHPHGANSYYTLPPTLSEATDRGKRDAD
jgi:ATP-dependent DNA helicase RecG